MKRVFNVAAFVCGMDEEYPYQIIQGIMNSPGNTQ